MNPPGIPSATRRINVCLIGLFMALLWLPTLDTAFHIDWTASPDENRALAGWPKAPAGWRDWRTYVTGLEACFNDHFGFRKCLVLWHNKMRWFLFREQDLHNVLAGKDGWLFFTEYQMIDHYSGRSLFTPAQLHDWQVLLEKRRDWLARRGIAYVFVVPPDKHTIYPEELPDWLVKVCPQTKLDQFFAYMRAHSTVPVADLRDALRRAKQIRPDYLQTDTHWNNFGAFAGYQELVRALARQRPGLAPLPLSAFTVTNRLDPSVKGWWQTNHYWLAPVPATRQLEPNHDLATMLGRSMAESNACFLLPRAGLRPFTVRYGQFDQTKEPWFTRNPHATGRLMVFRDSYATCWVQFLGYHFNKVTYLWQNELAPGWIGRDQPDIVVSEMLERLFNTTDPKKLMAREGLD